MAKVEIIAALMVNEISKEKALSILL